MWRSCSKCRALIPAETPFCPNCAPRGAAFLRWFRGAVGAAGLGLLGGSSACCLNPSLESVGDAGDAGQLEDAGDAGSADAGTPDAGDAGVADAGRPDA